MPVRCLNAKGEIRFIPDKLAGMPDYMRRHNLTIDNVEAQEPLKPLKEVNLIVEPINENQVSSESIGDMTPQIEITKEEYWAMLDTKGVDYKKTFGIAKLKELNDAN
jgi:hypothetical protein